MFVTEKFPKVGCSYIPPDQCTGSVPAPCCERIDIDDSEGAGVIITTSVALLLVISTLVVVL